MSAVQVPPVADEIRPAAASVGFPAEPDIRPEHFGSVVPHPLVAHLRTREAESGYRSVYRVGRGVDRWCAKVRVNHRLMRLKGSGSHLPHQAALYVVLWYRERFGVHWTKVPARSAGRSSGQPPWRVWRAGSVRLVNGAECRGYAARVWEHGRPAELTGRRNRGCDGDAFDTLANCTFRGRDWTSCGRLLIFATKDDAAAAVRAWIEQRWGDEAASAVWRW